MSGNGPADTDILDIAVRAFGLPEGKKEREWDFPSRGPSRWLLIFDTETTTDETQRLRLGAYQLRHDGHLREQGLFYDATALSQSELSLLRNYAAKKGLRPIDRTVFSSDVFVRAVHQWQATLIGFNLPFDISRVATEYGEARGKMRPGFTFGTGEKTKGPRIRVKHLSRRNSLIEASGAGQRLPRGQRKRRVALPPRRPAFVDVGTLAAALLSRTFSLAGLAKELKTPHQKLDTDEHGKALTPEYLDYALQDVQVTFECFIELSRRYAEYGLSHTPIPRILSEASIGKAHLREMGIRPLRQVQPDVPPDLFGKIMGTYYGGRTEVHQRRVVTQVLYCDFLSMYPTVSTLMRLWPYVIAKGFTWRDATADTVKFLDSVTLSDLQRPETWQRLHAIVQVAPDADILPLRAKYGYGQSAFAGDRHYTIGLNYVTSNQPLWYTLADCIASKLLTGRAPKILNALAFQAGEPQNGLRPVAIAGNPEFTVDPLKEDFFKRIIELRMQTQGPARNALKLVANATGYGIFVQLDVNERSEPVAIRCCPASGQQFLVDMDKVEEPGEFFHPLLGTLITGAARLMLAIAERMVLDAGLTWAFCDTDSMAIAKPPGMSSAEFLRRAECVRSWFKPLNPYESDIELFKIEDANRALADGKLSKNLEPLYCFAISSKRYVMFNIDADGQPVIRKATAHGLGHLLPPYRDEDAPANLPRPAIPLNDIGVNRWQHDLWHCIARAALAGHPDRPDYSALPNFDQPVASQYTATTAHLLAWFDKFNEGKPYAEQVRPFNFLLMYQPDQLADWDAWRAEHGIELAGARTRPPCVIAPYDSDLREAHNRCFDRDTGKPIPATMLKSNLSALAQYHLRPEPKFLNADYLDSGETRRRHVKVESIVSIGKEANRWEEQSYLGIDPEAEISYGLAPQDRQERLARIKQAYEQFGPSSLAKAAEISRQHLSAIVSGLATPRDEMLARLSHAAATLEVSKGAIEADTEELFTIIRKIGVRTCASRAKIDAGNLTRLLKGSRRLTKSMLQKLKSALALI